MWLFSTKISETRTIGGQALFRKVPKEKNLRDGRRYII